MDKIYILTMIEDIGTGRQLDNKRTLGWYKSKEDAINAIMENKEGIRECLYDYALVEEKYTGAYTLSTDEFWFKWNYDECKFEPFEKPYWMRMLVNFGMG